MDRQVLTNTTCFLLVVKSVSPIIIVGRCIQYASRSVFFAFKKGKKVYININLFIFVSKKEISNKIVFIFKKSRQAGAL